jgi:hypothetical protein
MSQVVKFPGRKLYIIADEIVADWGVKINYAAKPYLEAMLDLNTIEENYFCDTGRSVVAYFLANAQTWRGDVARRVKKELKGML